MKIAMVQMSASTVDLASNYEKIISYCKTATDKGIQIICFPEMALIGYGFDGIEDRLDQQSKMLEELHTYARSFGLTILVGGIDRSESKDYLCQYVIDETIDVYHKIHVGSREQAHIAFGDTIKIFEVKGLKIGVILCYDGHFPELCTVMKQMGAHIIFNPSASPNDPKKRVAMWQKYLTARAYDNRCMVVATNLMFKGKGGGMLAIDSDGNKVSECIQSIDTMQILEYEMVDYEANTMRKRDFTKDRRQKVYNRYLLDGCD